MTHRVGLGSTAKPRVTTTLETCSDGRLGHPIDRCAVVNRCCNYSAFNGYRWTPSDYSLVRCSCGSLWRTRAAYVAGLPDAPRYAA